MFAVLQAARKRRKVEREILLSKIGKAKKKED